jgi:hypothetical protein
MQLCCAGFLLQDQGVALHLRKAAVHWTSDAPASTLWSALLLHDLLLVAGAYCLGLPLQ